MVIRDMDKHYEREAKMQAWRLLTPFFSVVSTVVVSAFSFFLFRMVNQFDDRNKSMMEEIHSIAQIQREYQKETEQNIVGIKTEAIQRYTELRYRCCSEIRSLN